MSQSGVHQHLSSWRYRFFVKRAVVSTDMITSWPLDHRRCCSLPLAATHYEVDASAWVLPHCFQCNHDTFEILSLIDRFCLSNSSSTSSPVQRVPFMCSRWLVTHHFSCAIGYRSTPRVQNVNMTYSHRRSPFDGHPHTTVASKFHIIDTLLLQVNRLLRTVDWSGANA